METKQKEKSLVRLILAGIFYWLFLKTYGVTRDQYWTDIYEEEKLHRKLNNLPL